MTYSLDHIEIVQTPVLKEDGSYDQTVGIYTKIDGAYENKFIQLDSIVVNISGSLTISEATTYIESQAVGFINNTYNNPPIEE